jgi:hypothetical protein
MRLVLLLTGWLPFLLALETAVPTGVHNEPFSEAPPEVRLSPRAQDEIKQVEARIDKHRRGCAGEIVPGCFHCALHPRSSYRVTLKPLG